MKPVVILGKIQLDPGRGPRSVDLDRSIVARRVRGVGFSAILCLDQAERAQEAQRPGFLQKSLRSPDFPPGRDRDAIRRFEDRNIRTV